MGRQQPGHFTAQDGGGGIQYRRLICGQRLHSWKRPESPRRRRGCRKVSSVNYNETPLYGHPFITESFLCSDKEKAPDTL